MQDITGLEKPLEKLVETVSEGIGIVSNHFFKFDVAKIKRIGKAEAEVEKEKIIAHAEAQKKAIEILGRAEKRFALEQYNKQINLENILVRTKDELKGKTVLEEPVEKDWTMRFLDIAQNVSREELQDVLAKILSGEIQKPGSFSYQTLEVVKLLSQRDLQGFQKFVACSTELGFIKLKSGGKNWLEKYDLDFNDYLNLASIGIFNQSSTVSFDINLPALKPLYIRIGKDWFGISHDEKEKTKHFNFGLYVFSSAGKELYLLLADQSVHDKSEEYKTDFIEEAQNKGFKVAR